MATIVTRAGKGSPLTHNEVDANFTNLNTAKAELASPALTGNVTVASNSATAAVTITQIGAGNALVVEDSASPDATPFVVTATGSVGIGTTTPATLLHLSSVDPVFITMIDQGNSAGRVGQSGTAMTFGVDGVNGATERMRIDNAGRVGVGVTPSAWDSNIKAIQFPAGSVAAYGTTGSVVLARNGFYDGTNWIYTASSTASNYEQDAGQHRWFNAPSGTAGNALTFTRAMTLDANGNLGIGTTGPAEKLDVVGKGVFTSNADILTLKYASDAGSARLAWKNVAGTTLWDVVGGMVIRQDELAIRRAGTSVMYFDNANNVGIGTTTPTASLDVLTQVTGALGISVRGRSSDNTSDISLKSNDATTVYGQIQGRSTDLRVQTGTALPITFYTTAAERMRIDASGFVGIGTGSPSALLQVDGGEIRQVQYGNNANYLTYTASGTQAAPTAISAATTLSLNSARAYDGSAYRDVTSIRSISDGAITSTSSPGYLTFRTTPSGTVVTVERMRITSDGNVGIGTTSPVTKLDVNGDITVRGAGSEGGQISLYNPDRTTTGLYIDVGSANTGRIFQVENNSVLTIGQLVGTGGIITFSTAAAERMRIDSTGAIGIGGANYGTSGQVLTSGGVGAAPSWADGINRGTAVASTSGTAIDFTGIPSWAKRITVLFHGVSINTSVDLLVQIGSTTFTTTGYSSASGQAQSGGTTTITSSTAGFHISDGNSSYLMSGSLVINMLGSNLINATGVFTGISTMVSTAGRVTITGAIDRVRVTSVGGAATFDAGTINVMWE